MRRQLSILTLILICFFCSLGCSTVDERVPSGPVARFGTAPMIDGIFDEGEWDDAGIIQAGEYQQFRIKHDSTNLYFAMIGDGGNLFFDKGKELHVLHASAQLGSAIYAKSDDSILSLTQPYSYSLWGVQDQPLDTIHDRMAGYLAENGWVGSIGGNKAESEFAISFDWLGVAFGSDRFVEIPGIYVNSGCLVGPDEIEEFLKLSLEERKRQYPTLYWPGPPVPNDSLCSGYCPETISLDSTGWGTIWIDLEE